MSLNWSAERDRAFHDWIFSQIDRDRFHFYYTGYITIKRFGDLVAPYLQSCSRILDVGCGPGEITCYLAQKFPDKIFLGVDHSSVGIQKAEKNRARLGLSNVCFEARDFFENPPVGPFDIILFLDSFHHFRDPQETITQVERLSDRILMIEPHGDSQGNQVRSTDFDWLNIDLHKIRDHISRILGDEQRGQQVTVDDPMPRLQALGPRGEATEYRYPPEFYETLLQAFDLDVHGTVSGLDVYGDNLYEITPSNYLCNRLLLDLLESIDDRLWSTGHDIFAKQWIIYGEKKGKSHGRAFDGFARYRTLSSPTVSAAATEAERIAGFYDMSYGDCRVPPVVRPGSKMRVWIHVINRGSGVWTSRDPHNPVHLSYHWLSQNREVVLFNGHRTILPKSVGPGECAHVRMKIRTPLTPGRYILQLDMVREFLAWFSQQGQPPFECEVLVAP